MNAICKILIALWRPAFLPGSIIQFALKLAWRGGAGKFERCAGGMGHNGRKSIFV
jgi:hypothetical protein